MSDIGNGTREKVAHCILGHEFSRSELSLFVALNRKDELCGESSAIGTDSLPQTICCSRPRQKNGRQWPSPLALKCGSLSLQFEPNRARERAVQLFACLFSLNTISLSLFCPRKERERALTPKTLSHTLQVSVQLARQSNSIACLIKVESLSLSLVRLRGRESPNKKRSRREEKAKYCPAL